ncbi:hypothetical protein GCM10020218_010440 [Dactylosporangium vinaceum]
MDTQADDTIEHEDCTNAQLVRAPTLADRRPGSGARRTVSGVPDRRPLRVVGVRVGSGLQADGPPTWEAAGRVVLTTCFVVLLFVVEREVGRRGFEPCRPGG